MLGHIAAKYESRGGWGTISTVRGDPGGKSYGKFQIAIKTGTLARFVKFSKQTSLKKYKIGGRAFDREWKRLAKTKGFKEEQLQFILKKHYEPLRSYTKLPNTRAINEALFSMSVQHGKAKTIINRTMRYVSGNDTEETIIRVLYRERLKYVRGLRKLSKKLKQVLADRYVREMRDVLKLVVQAAPKRKPIPKSKIPVILSDKKDGKFASIIVIILIIIGLVLGVGDVL